MEKYTEFSFDMEWRVTFQKGQQSKTSLIQLAVDRQIILFHIFHMDTFPIHLRKLLESPRFLKYGVNIQNDASKLLRDFKITPTGLLDLSHLANAVFPQVIASRRTSLDDLTRLLLGFCLSKKDGTRISNWDVPFLSSEQEHYAANDVFAGLQIFEKIKLSEKYNLMRGGGEKAVPLQKAKEILLEKKDSEILQDVQTSLYPLLDDLMEAVPPLGARNLEGVVEDARNSSRSDLEAVGTDLCDGIDFESDLQNWSHSSARNRI